MQTIVVVGEGERAQQMAQELSAAGYEVEVNGDASGIDARANVLVIDGAPDAELARAISAGRQKPAILAVLSEEALDAPSLDSVADDVAFHPLRPHELEARVRRLLEKRGPPDSPEVLRQGPLAIDTAGYHVYVDGLLVELTFKEYELLRFLATHPDRVYSREALLNRVWGYDYFGGARTVDVHIRRIRSKIERGGHTFIETVRSVGYRFHASS